jgi:hypothetical protein
MRHDSCRSAGTDSALTACRPIATAPAMCLDVIPECVNTAAPPACWLSVSVRDAHARPWRCTSRHDKGHHRLSLSQLIVVLYVNLLVACVVDVSVCPRHGPDLGRDVVVEAGGAFGGV